MSERKVLNKYYPPDFDPSKIPRSRQGKNRQFTVRLMAPCNMRCNTCGEYIYKGKKFNARKEDVENEDYLGIRIYRFYIKCTRCLQEISFKTDPQSTDYVIEAGATRNFMALKLAEEQAEREEQAEKEEEATNPMKLLEKRTESSKNEMAVLEALEELKELNQRKVAPDHDTMLEKYDELRDAETLKIEEEDNKFIQSVFGNNGQVIRRIEDDSSEEDSDEDKPSSSKRPKMVFSKSTDLLTSDVKPVVGRPEPEKEKSVGMLSVNKKNLVLVKPKSSAVSVKPELIKIEPKDNANSASKDNQTSTTPNALGLLGAYSSDSDE